MKNLFFAGLLSLSCLSSIMAQADSRCPQAKLVCQLDESRAVTGYQTLKTYSENYQEQPIDDDSYAEGFVCVAQVLIPNTVTQLAQDQQVRLVLDLDDSGSTLELVSIGSTSGNNPSVSISNPQQGQVINWNLSSDLTISCQVQN